MSGHGQLIVGYDDDKGDPSAPGAFLIQNSFGPQWPSNAPGGRIWWAYQTFLMSQKLAAVAYSVDPQIPTSGELQTALATPRGVVRGVQHWVDPKEPSNVYLIVDLLFTEPVLLNTARIDEPSTGTEVTQSYGLPLGNGYLFFRRVDGAQFVHGNYGLSLDVTTRADGHGTFDGTITVGASVPTAPTPQPIAAPIYDTIGRTATVEPGEALE